MSVLKGDWTKVLCEAALFLPPKGDGEDTIPEELRGRRSVCEELAI